MRMTSLLDLPDDVLELISSHLADLSGVSSASKELRFATRAEAQRRMDESFLYYRTLRMVCLSPRLLRRHARLARNPEDHAPLPQYRCGMCGGCVREVGGCYLCKVMVRKHPWMRSWHKRIPHCVVRMFHER